jgi:formamidopyrimidine-DNA glycosylase
MPELPEVEHVKRGIEPYAKGQTITSVIFSDKVKEGKADGRETIIKGMSLDTFKTFTEHFVIKQIERRSKYIVFHLVKSFLEIAPEPFEDEALSHYLSWFDRKSYVKKPIKQMILDHRVIAGCGNIYACEALFRAGIHPNRTTNSLNNQEREMLFYYVREVLSEGIKYGGTSVSDYRTWFQNCRCRCCFKKSSRKR